MGVQRVQVLSFVLLQRGSNDGVVVVPEERRRSQLFQEAKRGSRDQERELVQSTRLVHDHERGSGDAIKLPNEADSSRFVDPAII